MSDEWVETPRHAPHRCFLTGNSSVEAGPYYEFARGTYDLVDNFLQSRTIYLSPEAVETICEALGSPVSLSGGASDTKSKKLAKRVAELEAEVAELKAMDEADKVEIAATVADEVKAKRGKKQPPKRTTGKGAA